ncbi:MAG: hypothetical protein ABSE73_23310, partial [Planctomycetota bacterium]
YPGDLNSGFEDRGSGIGVRGAYPVPRPPHPAPRSPRPAHLAAHVARNCATASARRPELCSAAAKTEPGAQP